MSMWEIEALVEESILLVSKSNLTQVKQRDLIWNLYQVQGQFDCSFTNFRVLDTLLTTGYTHTLQLEDYPNYNQHAAKLLEIKEENFAYLYQDLYQPWSRSNPVVAYWDKRSQVVYYDIDSPFYTQLQPTPVPPISLSLIDTALVMVKLAHEQENKAFVYHWIALTLNNYWLFGELSNEELIEKYLTEMRQIFSQYDYTHFEPLHESLTMQEAPNEYFEDKANELISWFNV